MEGNHYSVIDELIIKNEEAELELLRQVQRRNRIS